MTKEIYQIYSDESNNENRRLTSICTISGHYQDLNGLRNLLCEILKKFKIKEAKFSEIKTHRPKIESAQEFVKVAVEFASNGKIRIDILTFDRQDSRHNVIGRDDTKNLEIMYYKLIRHCCERWKKHDWEFYPDENSAYNWEKIKTYLNSTKSPRREIGLLQLFREKISNLNFTKVEQKCSHDEPLIQLADIFAGCACFSIIYGVECLSLIHKEENKNLGFLFDDLENETENFNKTKINRSILVKKFNDLCKKHRLGVSLKTQKHLWTPNPENPINFWIYKPQSEYDKAPTRKKQ